MNLQPVLYHFTNVPPAIIADKKAPIIVPFGPTYTGKTMVLYRLFQLLRSSEGYFVDANSLFVDNSLSSSYTECVNTFFDGLNQGHIAVANTQMPLLFDIRKNGVRICHILD